MRMPDDGGPAFPQPDLSGYGIGPSEVGNGGMSLRDWFAGQALAGWMAMQPDPKADDPRPLDMAAGCYQLADAMLSARQKDGAS